MESLKKIIEKYGGVFVYNKEKFSKESMRGTRANQIWHPFIDGEGNGCCINILTGDTYIDWTKEELDGE